MDDGGIVPNSEVDVATDLLADRLERLLPVWHGGEAPVVVPYPSARHLPLKSCLLLNALSRHVGTVLGEDKEVHRHLAALAPDAGAPPERASRAR